MSRGTDETRPDPFSGLAVDHVAIAVPSLDEALRFWRDALGAECIGTEEVPSQKVRVAFLATGNAKTELLEPTAPDSPIARFLDQGRRGLHHVAYRVDDIDATLARLRESEVRLIHDADVPGSRGTRVAFVHPGGTGGVLVELVEHTGGEPAGH